jgi:hypothetical protein
MASDPEINKPAIIQTVANLPGDLGNLAARGVTLGTIDARAIDQAVIGIRSQIIGTLNAPYRRDGRDPGDELAAMGNQSPEVQEAIRTALAGLYALGEIAKMEAAKNQARTRK